MNSKLHGTEKRVLLRNRFSQGFHLAQFLANVFNQGRHWLYLEIDIIEISINNGYISQNMLS